MTVNAAPAVAIPPAADGEDDEEEEEEEEEYLVDLLPRTHSAPSSRTARAAEAAEDRPKKIGVAAACHSFLTPESAPSTPTTNLTVLAQQSFSRTPSTAASNDFPKRVFIAPVGQRAAPTTSAPSGGVVGGRGRSGNGGRGGGGGGSGGGGAGSGGGGGGGGGDGGRGRRGGGVCGAGAGGDAAAAAAAASASPAPTRLVSRVVRKAATVDDYNPATCCGAATCFCERCDPDFAALAEFGLAHPEEIWGGNASGRTQRSASQR